MEIFPRAEQRLRSIVEASTALLDIHKVLERLQGATGARKQVVEATLNYLDEVAKTNPAYQGKHIRIAILEDLYDKYMKVYSKKRQAEATVAVMPGDEPVGPVQHRPRRRRVCRAAARSGIVRPLGAGRYLHAAIFYSLVE